MADHPAIERCRNACLAMGFSHPHFLLIHAKIRNQYVIASGGDSMSTMGITSSGSITINPSFVMGLDKNELGGVLAHEMLHLVLVHHERRGGRDPWVWNIATDMCINNALKADSIRLPSSALYPPSQYDGELWAEALYDWLMKNPDHVPQKPQIVMPCAGCAPIDDSSSANQPDWKQTAIEARAMAQHAGKGTGGVATLLTPQQPKINWRKIIRNGFQMATAKPGRDFQTFARRHRRSPASGVQFPGWQGLSPRIAISLDVSGSMNPKWIEKIVTEVKNLLKQFPNTRCYLNAHTSEVVWKGWITDQTQADVNKAVQFSGGTDPNPAYADIKQQGKFDSMVHFTDTEFYDEEWPEVPARHLIVGMFASKPYCKPPDGATVIPCDLEE